ncbi:MAG TPA: type II toxin-antitoxin system VapC family toxin [Ignavibacteria bacterium]|nr:type II toxin-antitoxin system VapC family toxin [Ignavibacteria bacterium]
MESGKILADTSIIIEHLRMLDKVNSTFSIHLKSFKIYLSSVTIFELYCGATEKRKKNDIETLCRFTDILNIDKTTSEIAGSIYIELKNKGFTIGTEDLLIASSALQYDLPVLTLNRKHFKIVKNIKLI